MRWIALLVLAIAAQAFAQPGEQQVQQDMLVDGTRLRVLHQAMILYAQDHDGELPPDLASTIDYVVPKNTTPAERDRKFAEALIAPGVPAAPIPADVKADWVNQNSSYAYLGGGGIRWEEVPSWGDIVVVHLKLDAGHPAGLTPQNPDGQMFALAFNDNHVEVTTRAEAVRLIEQSRLVLDALRTGGPMPDDRQAAWDLQRIMEAINAYTQAHKGELPPDLGSTLSYIKPDKKRLVTAAQRAGVFLSPAARRNTHIPEDPTPDWVNRSTSYVFLAALTEGDKPLIKERLEDPSRTILVHGRLDWAMDIIQRGGTKATVVPLGTVWCNASLLAKEYAESIIAESKKVVSAAQHGTPLPDYQHEHHDLRLLLKALNAYARAHKGELPTDLGATIPFLPDDELPMLADRARVYLSPKAERLLHVPDELTPEWVNKNASYVYLAAGPRPVSLAAFTKGGMPMPLLVHAPLDEACDVLFESVAGLPSSMRVVPGAYTMGVSYLLRDRADEDIADARKQLDAQRAK